MSPETRAFLETVRGSEDPSVDDELRVLEAVRSAVAAPPLLARAGAPKPRPTSLLSKASGLKLLGALAGVTASVTVVALMLSSHDGTKPRPAPAHTTERVVAPSATISGTFAPPIVGAPSPSSRAPARAKAPRPASLREELALLADVQAALERGDGATALRRLDAHVTDDRQFTAERRAARILALCALGRIREARAGAALFLSENPGSVQRTAVERSCAGTQSSEPR